jgi:hypothetical protein
MQRDFIHFSCEICVYSYHINRASNAFTKYRSRAGVAHRLVGSMPRLKPLESYSEASSDNKCMVCMCFSLDGNLKGASPVRSWTYGSASRSHPNIHNLKVFLGSLLNTSYWRTKISRSFSITLVEQGCSRYVWWKGSAAGSRHLSMPADSTSKQESGKENATVTTTQTTVQGRMSPHLKLNEVHYEISPQDPYDVYVLCTI